MERNIQIRYSVLGFLGEVTFWTVRPGFLGEVTSAPEGMPVTTEPFEDNGVVYQLALSAKSATGYKCVVEERKGEFHAKGGYGR